MISMILVVCCIALNEEPTRLRTGLHHANEIAARCANVDDACIETIRHDGVLDKPYKVRLKVESVTADKAEQATIINGVSRWTQKKLAEWRTLDERQAIKNSVFKTRQMKDRHAKERNHDRDRFPVDGSSLQRKQFAEQKRRRQAEKRSRRREHLQLLEQLNRTAQGRRNQIENVQVRLLARQYEPSDFAGKKYVNCVIRVDSFILRPGIDEIGSPAAVAKLNARLEAVILKKQDSSEEATAQK